MKTQITTTELVSETFVAELVVNLQAAGAEIDGPHLIMRKSTTSDLQQWVQLYAEEKWLLLLASPFALYASQFVGTMAKKSAEDFYSFLKSRKKLNINDPILPLAECIERAKCSGDRATSFRIGLPFPSEYFGIDLEVTARNAQEIAQQISIFANKAEAISRVTKLVADSEDGVLGGFKVEVVSEDELSLEWMTMSGKRSESLKS
jgi:hypothetical protein